MCDVKFLGLIILWYGYGFHQHRSRTNSPSDIILFCDEREINNDVRDQDDDQGKVTCHEVTTFCVIVKYTNESLHWYVLYLQDNLVQSTKYAW